MRSGLLLQRLYHVSRRPKPLAFTASVFDGTEFDADLNAHDGTQFDADGISNNDTKFTFPAPAVNTDHATDANSNSRCYTKKRSERNADISVVLALVSFLAFFILVACFFYKRSRNARSTRTIGFELIALTDDDSELTGEYSLLSQTRPLAYLEDSADALPTDRPLLDVRNAPGRWDFFLSHTQRNEAAKLLASEVLCFVLQRRRPSRSVYLSSKMETSMRHKLLKGIAMVVWRFTPFAMLTNEALLLAAGAWIYVLA